MDPEFQKGRFKGLIASCHCARQTIERRKQRVPISSLQVQAAPGTDSVVSLPNERFSIKAASVQVLESETACGLDLR